MQTPVEVYGLIVSAIVTVVIGYFAYRLTQSNFTATLMISCIERWQSILSMLGNASDSLNTDSTNLNRDLVRQNVARKYIDLCNEEMFYFTNMYFPRDVEIEWLEAMVYYLPHLEEVEEDGKNKYKNLNKQASCVFDGLSDDFLNEVLLHYPKLKNALTVDRQFYSPNERNELTKRQKLQVLQSIQSYFGLDKSMTKRWVNKYVVNIWKSFGYKKLTSEK